MDRIPVVSSHISEIGYDVQTMTLEVAYLDGGVYQFFDVPEAIHQELMASESQGKYMHANINGNYRYTKL